MIISAFFIGLIFSIPVGPLGVVMLKRSVEKGFWAGFTIAILDAIASFIFSLSFLVGIGQIELGTTIKLIAQLIGLILLAFISIKEIFFKKNKSKTKKNISLNKSGLLGNMLLVIGYYIANPTLWAFWVNISVYANSNLLGENNMFNSIIFSLLYALGVLTTQYLAIHIIKNIEKFKNLQKSLSYVSSGLFIATFSYFFYTTIKSISSQWNAFAQILNLNYNGFIPCFIKSLF